MNILNILGKNNNGMQKNINAKYLEELFIELQGSNSDNEKIFKSMKLALNNMTTDKCTDIFIGKDSRKVLFGMSVYLSDIQLEKMAKDIITNKTTTKEFTKEFINTSLEYVIEIDPKILKHGVYNFTPGELTAMLLHEIGHVTADTDFYNSLKDAYVSALYKIKAVENPEYKISEKDINLGMLYILSSIQDTHIKNMKSIDNEKIADRFAMEMGYQNELISAIDKFNKISVSNLSRENDSVLIERNAETIMKINNAFDIRKSYVISLLDSEAKLNGSSYATRLIDKIKSKMKRMVFMEAAPVFPELIINEGFISKFFMNPIKVSQSDIDDLKIQLEMMEDYDDKSLLVYKCHKRINQLNDAKKKISDTDRDYDYNIKCIDSYIKQINNILSDALKKKIETKTYGVFIKYPKGYEG